MLFQPPVAVAIAGTRLGVPARVTREQLAYFRERTRGPLVLGVLLRHGFELNVDSRVLASQAGKDRLFLVLAMERPPR